MHYQPRFVYQTVWYLGSQKAALVSFHLLYLNVSENKITLSVVRSTKIKRLFFTSPVMPTLPI